MSKKEIKVRVTEEEHQKIKEKAAAKGMSLSAYGAYALLNRRDRAKDDSHLLEFTEVLERNNEQLVEINNQMRDLLRKHGDDALIAGYVLEEVAITLRETYRDTLRILLKMGGGDDGNT